MDVGLKLLKTASWGCVWGRRTWEVNKREESKPQPNSLNTKDGGSNTWESINCPRQYLKRSKKSIIVTAFLLLFLITKNGEHKKQEEGRYSVQFYGWWLVLSRNTHLDKISQPLEILIWCTREVRTGNILELNIKKLRIEQDDTGQEKEAKLIYMYVFLIYFISFNKVSKIGNMCILCNLVRIQTLASHCWQKYGKLYFSSILVLKTNTKTIVIINLQVKLKKVSFS